MDGQGDWNGIEYALKAVGLSSVGLVVADKRPRRGGARRAGPNARRLGCTSAPCLIAPDSTVSARISTPG